MKQILLTSYDSGFGGDYGKKTDTITDLTISADGKKVTFPAYSRSFLSGYNKYIYITNISRLEIRDKNKVYLLFSSINVTGPNDDLYLDVKNIITYQGNKVITLSNGIKFQIAEV